MSDVGRKTVPDKGRLNRERPVTKALEFPFCARKSFFHRHWNVEYEMEYTQKDRMTDVVALYHQRNERSCRGMFGFFETFMEGSVDHVIYKGYKAY